MAGIGHSDLGINTQMGHQGREKKEISHRTVNNVKCCKKVKQVRDLDFANVLWTDRGSSEVAE